MLYICTMCSQPKEKFRTDERRSRKEWKYKDANGHCVHGRVCAACKLKQQATRRFNSCNATTQKYEKTPNGFLMRMYRNMISRVSGIQHKKAHLYCGLEILEKQEFYEWAKSSKEFWNLFNTYQESGFQQRLAPTVDRIDSSIGYIPSNMRWLTHSENSRLGSLSKRDKSRPQMINDAKAVSPLDEPGSSVR